MADNIHSGHRERMRKRILEHGMHTLQDHELLEVLLYYCIPLRDTNALAHKLLNEFGSLRNLLTADTVSISKRANVSERTALLITLITEFMTRYNIGKWDSEELDFSSSDTVGEYATSILQVKTKECFYAFYLDARNKLIKNEIIAEGVVNEIAVSVRIVTEKALKNNAVSVILAHNHPGGTLAASAEDVYLTQAISKALSIVGISVLDHIIVARNRYISFAQLGLLTKEK